MSSFTIYYRFFSKKEYRDEFIKGCVRFGSLEYYRNIEDEAIRDINEGKPQGRYKTNLQRLTINKDSTKIKDTKSSYGEMHFSGESPNAIFICALSDERADIQQVSKKLNKKFAVKICKVDKLLARLNKKKEYPGQIGNIRLGQVKYGRGGYLKMEENQTLSFEKYYLQKSPVFAYQHEWRFAVIVPPEKGCCNHLYIWSEELSDISDIIDL